MSIYRNLSVLFRTPVTRVAVPGPTSPAAIELSSYPGLRPRSASRTLSFLNSSPYQTRGYASAPGKQELYSDEAGGTGAGTDDVAHSDAAFNKDTNPESAGKQVEQETGKDFTKKAPTNEKYSDPTPGSQGDKDGLPMDTGKGEQKK